MTISISSLHVGQFDIIKGIYVRFKSLLFSTTEIPPKRKTNSLVKLNRIKNAISYSVETFN